MGAKDGEEDYGNRKMHCTTIVNAISFNISPFRYLRLTCSSDFYVRSDGVDALGTIIIKNVQKKQISAISSSVGFLLDTEITIDVSNINEHVFTEFVFISILSKMHGGTVTIKKIELLN